MPPSGDRTGATDTRNLQAVLSSGQLAQLAPGQTYYVRNRLVLRHGGTGLACIGGQARIVMLTGPGQFDLSSYDYSQHFGDHHVLVYAEGIDRPVLDGLHATMQPTSAGPRLCIPFVLRGCSDLAVGALEYSGFYETWRGMLSLDSCHGGRVDSVYAHDCNPDSTSLPAMQVTAVLIDDNRLEGRSCSDIVFGRVRYRNLVLGPRALAKYGPQTDAVSVASSGPTRLRFDLIDGDGVGEVLDCYGDQVTATIVAKNTQLYPVKLVAGASNNRIKATIDGTGLSAVYIGGTKVVPGRLKQGSGYNRIEVHATRVGALHATLARGWAAGAMQPAIYFDNTSDFDPHHNFITGDVAADPSAGMPFVVAGSTRGLGNHVEVSGTGFREGFAHWAPGVPPAEIVQRPMAGRSPAGPRSRAPVG